MTEPDVASSDATNIGSLIVRDGDDYLINGRKWYTTGATDPRCQIIIFMGQTDPDRADRYRRQSMVLVPKDTPGLCVVRSASTECLTRPARGTWHGCAIRSAMRRCGRSS